MEVDLSIIHLVPVSTTQYESSRTVNSAVKAVYVTAPNRETASNLAETVIGERLAACVNMIDTVESLYWWDGQIQRDREILLIFKTSEDRHPELTRRLTELHPYDCPCITVLPVEAGNPAYLQWVRNETNS